MGTPVTSRTARRPVLTLRGWAALLVAGAAIYGAALIVTVSWVVVPRIESLRQDTEVFQSDLDGYARESARLDSTVAAAHGLLDRGEAASAIAVLEEARRTPAASLSASGVRAMVGAPVEMRAALSSAADSEARARDLLGEALSRLRLGEVERASETLHASEAVLMRLAADLAAAQQAGLRDVARRGAALEATINEALRTFLLWGALGFVLLGATSVVMHRRFYLPMRALDAGMRALARGELDTALEVEHADELGRLAELFNEAARTLQIRESERRMERQAMTRRILDATLDGVITVDVDGTVIGWNPAAEAIFGWSAEEMLGAPVQHVIPEAYQGRHSEQFGGRSGSVGPAVFNRRLELPAVRKDGRQFTAEMSLVPILEEGASVAYAAFLRDVTEQRRTEAAIRKSEALLRSIMDNSSAIVTLKDLDGRYQLMNRRGLEVMGRTEEEVLGRTADEILAPGLGEAVRAHDAEALRTRRPLQCEEHFELDGQQHTLISVRFPLLDEEGEPWGTAGISTDVTESMALEEQVRRSQRLEALGRVAGGIAHDFNNLVTVILGQTQLALDEDPQPLVQEGLREIEKAATRAATLTGQLLAFARKQMVRPQRVELNHLVRDTLDMVHRVLEATVAVRTDLGADVGDVYVDPGHFSQVLLNLVMNSRDAMGPNGGAVRISTRPADGPPPELPEGPYLMLSVEDDGPGILPEVLPRVFEPFYTTKATGTGLGLATCHGIVHQAGGTIEAGSSEMGGARFTVWLPALPAEAS